MCRTRVFCCGCSLTAGAITASVLQGLATIGMLVIGIKVLMVATWIESDDPLSDQTWLGTMIASVVKVQKPVGYSERDEKTREEMREDWAKSREEREALGYWLRVVGIIQMIIMAISFLILVSLVIAIVKKNACLVMPWLIGNMIKIVLDSIVGFLFLMFMWVLAPILLLPLAFHIYLWIVLLNYYRELQEPAAYQPSYQLTATAAQPQYQPGYQPPYQPGYQPGYQPPYQPGYPPSYPHGDEGNQQTIKA